ncbi:hypothetical protein Rhal01_02604 [Rubritalea halochordaticola]|uniref:Exosortase-associated EpsI family protein n=1 Tax=Rubritalea halochordaticola TaxID=714537 RepID=A0ABP9V154_9BACT
MKCFAMMILSVFMVCVCAAEPAPLVGIDLDKLLDTQVMKEHREQSATLDKLLSGSTGQKARMTIVCMESQTSEGSRHLQSPLPLLLGRGDEQHSNGDYVRVYESYLGTARRTVKGRKHQGYSFHLTLDYQWEGRKGILIVPFWVEMDRSQPSQPVLKRWLVDNEQVSFLEQDSKS